MDENAKKMAKVMAKCWADEKFKKELIADPARVLKEQGIEVPAGLKVSFHENTEKEAHIIIPPKPSAELSDEQLDKVAGGANCTNTAGTIGCLCIVTAGTVYCH